MVRTLVVMKNGNVVTDAGLELTTSQDVAWFWTDFDNPTEEEARLLSSHFHFHPLAVEDCLHFLQRPKIDIYDEFLFFVLHALGEKSIRPKEINVFLGSHFLVTFHKEYLNVFTSVWDQIQKESLLSERNPIFIFHKLIDTIVDQYFPILVHIDNEIEKLGTSNLAKPNPRILNKIYHIQRELLILRRTLVPQREVLNRIMHMDEQFRSQREKAYFADVFDHLTRLVEMSDTDRDLANNLLSNYLSLNSFRMNRVMMVLTVITTIFMPLTFIVGVYGMNFDNIPELHWKYGYFIVWGVMIGIAIFMIQWFRRRGWFS